MHEAHSKIRRRIRQNGIRPTNEILQQLFIYFLYSWTSLTVDDFQAIGSLVTEMNDTDIKMIKSNVSKVKYNLNFSKVFTFADPRMN